MNNPNPKNQNSTKQGNQPQTKEKQKEAQEAPGPYMSASPIQPGETQFVVYRNGFIKAQCHSDACVIICWGSFTQPVSAKIWDNREIFSQPQNVRLLQGDECSQALEFFIKKDVETHRAVQLNKQLASAKSSVNKPKSTGP